MRLNLANGFANGWRLKGEDFDHAKTWEMVIEFVPQRWFYGGLLVLLFSLVGYGVYFIINRRRGKL